MYINDTGKNISKNKFHPFAEDTILCVQGKNLEIVINAINVDLVRTYELRYNKLKLNIKKSNAMFLTEREEYEII